MMKKRNMTLFLKRGSAIIMALVVMTMLVLLGLAVVTVTMGTLESNAADAENNDAYYAAESAVTSAIEQLKYEVSAYYTLLEGSTFSGYGALFDNFFFSINSSAQSHFVEPAFSGITTQTTFSTGSFDTANSICEFLVSCTATASNNTKYRVTGALYVKKVDLRASGPTWLEIDDAAYKVGGTLNLSAGFGVTGGNVVASAVSNPKNKYYSIAAPYQLIIANPVINNVLTYPSYTTPSLSNPDVYVTVNNTVLGYGSFPTNRPVVITGAPGINFTIDSSTSIYPGSVVYSRGNLTVKPTMTATSPIYCYADGNITASNGPVYANLYCRGSATTSGNFHGIVYCDGNATIGNSFYGTVISGGNLSLSGGLNGSFYASGQVTITNGDQGNAVIYAGTKLIVGSGNYLDVVLFSGGDLDITGGSSLRGALIARGNVNESAWLTLTYSRSVIENVMNNLPQNNFFFGGSGGSIQPLNEDVFISKSITAQGRLP